RSKGHREGARLSVSFGPRLLLFVPLVCPSRPSSPTTPVFPGIEGSGPCNRRCPRDLSLQVIGVAGSPARCSVEIKLCTPNRVMLASARLEGERGPCPPASGGDAYAV